ncbi:MAG: PASTA domain-containing protein [Clostridia bacterium]|nr:PASTA domain-containing protein [Clostridia bacterium]
MKKCLGCMEEMEESLSVCPHCGYVEGTPPKEIYHIVPGTLLHGKYTVGRVLGYGGFGITYIGWDNELGRKVAIKEFLPSEFSTRMPGETMITVYNGEATEQFGAGLERFIEEAQRLAKFNSVGSVVDIYDTFIENNTGYIVMQCLEGDTVKSLLAKNGVMPYESAKLIIIEILKTLSAVHKEGIIHRDISPDNIFITNDNKIKLLDFGAARYASSYHSKSLSVILKPGYAPEEQYRSRGNQGPWSDVYATSATLYKMITGITIEESMERTVKDNVKSPAELGVNLPESANIAIMNALNIHAELRTQSADDFIKELTSDDVVRVIDKPKKGDAGKIPLWLKITAASILSVAVIFASLVLTGVLDISSIYLGQVASLEGRVPFVINKTVTDAEKELNDKKMGIYITGQDHDEIVAKDIIKAQSPDGGKKSELCVMTDADGRPMVEVVVSGGPAPRVVPNVVGLTREVAEQTLTELGFTIKVEEEYSDNIPAGTIMLQNHANEERDYGSEITITVSKGKMKVDESKTHAIPNLTGKSYEEAARMLSAIGMYTQKREEFSTAPDNQVIRQSVPANTTQKEGTVVVLTVSKNSITIPSVVYQTESAARANITKAGGNVAVSQEYSETVAAGLVIRQDVVGKTKYGVTVNIVVSKGSASRPQTPTPQTPTPQTPVPTPTPRITPTPTPRATPTPPPVATPQTPSVATIIVPNIVGLNVGTDFATADRTICSRYPKFADLNNRTYATVSGSGKAPGTVVRTSPSAGAAVSPGTKVTVYIAE